MAESTTARWRSTVTTGLPWPSVWPSGAPLPTVFSPPGPDLCIRAVEPSAGTKTWWRWFTLETSASTVRHWDTAPLGTSAVTGTSRRGPTRRKRRESDISTEVEEHGEGEAEEEQWGGRAEASHSRGHRGVPELCRGQRVYFHWYTHRFMAKHTGTRTYTLNLYTEKDRYGLYVLRL